MVRLEYRWLSMVMTIYSTPAGMKIFVLSIFDHITTYTHNLILIVYM